MRMIYNVQRRAAHTIPFSVLLTRTSAAITTRSLKNVRAQLAKGNIDVFMTNLVERAAFRDLLDFGGTLHDLDPGQVANVDKAIANAQAFAGEVLAKLKATGTQPGADKAERVA